MDAAAGHRAVCRGEHGKCLTPQAAKKGFEQEATEITENYVFLRFLCVLLFRIDGISGRGLTQQGAKKGFAQEITEITENYVFPLFPPVQN